jgi:restriction endonuclease S subunit
MPDWPEASLDSVCELITDGSHYSPKTLPSGYPYVTVRNIGRAGIEFDNCESVDEKTFLELKQAGCSPRRGDVLYSKDGTVGKLAVNDTDREFVVLSSLAILRPNVHLVSSAFLGLALSSEQFLQAATQEKTGLAIKRVVLKNLRRLNIPLPPQVEQRRIVDLIGAFDTQIDAVHTEATTLRRLYDQLLFTAIYGRTGNEVPKRVALRDCLDLEVNRVDVFPEHTYRIVGVLNAGRGLIDRGTITGDQTGYMTLNLLRRGQLVMRKLTAWEGPIAVVPDLYDACHASAEFPTFTPKSDRLTSDFLSHLCRWPGLWLEMKQRVTGSVQRRKRLSPDQLLDVKVPLPSLAAQMEYSLLLDAVLETVRGLEAESESSAVVRSSLLKALLMGDVDLDKSYDDLLQRTA